MPSHTDIERAKFRTKVKASRAKQARAVGGNSSTRMSSTINITKTAKAFNTQRMANLVRKSRSPAMMGFAIGLGAIIDHKKAKRINAGPI